MLEHNTSIVHCAKCGLRTRHYYRRWEQRILLFSLLTGRVRVIEGWECTKCGHRTRVRVRFLPHGEKS